MGESVTKQARATATSSFMSKYPADDQSMKISNAADLTSLWSSLSRQSPPSSQLLDCNGIPVVIGFLTTSRVLLWFYSGSWFAKMHGRSPSPLPCSLSESCSDPSSVVNSRTGKLCSVEAFELKARFGMKLLLLSSFGGFESLTLENVARQNQMDQRWRWGDYKHMIWLQSDLTATVWRLGITLAKTICNF